MLIRDNVRKEFTDSAVDSLDEKLTRRLQKKGRGAFASKHEILGILTEEFKELIDAVQSEPISGGKNTVREELLDIAVGCIFGVACIDAGFIAGEVREERAAA